MEAPHASLDGKKIFAVGSQRRSELVRYDSRSGQFLPYLNGISAACLSFSRDGKWIAYVSWPESELWRCRIDGSEKLQLTTAPAVVASVDWSPDGSQIGYAATLPGRHDGLFLVSASAGEARQIAQSEEVGLRGIGWTPDGKSVVTALFSGSDKVSIRIIDVKSANATEVSSFGTEVGAALSPDGRYIAGTPVDGQKLMLYDMAAQKWFDLAKQSVNAIRWSADSQYVYFDTQSNADPAIYRVRISDRKLETVASLKNLFAAPFCRTHPGWA